MLSSIHHKTSLIKSLKKTLLKYSYAILANIIEIM